MAEMTVLLAMPGYGLTSRAGRSRRGIRHSIVSLHLSFFFITLFLIFIFSTLRPPISTLFYFTFNQFRNTKMIAYTYFTILLSLSVSLASASPIKRANNQLIVSSRDQKCLSPAGGAAAVTAGQVGNGTPLISMDCAQAAGWDISPGSGSVILTGTSFAMDAGTTPGNNGQLKVRLHPLLLLFSKYENTQTYFLDLDFVPRFVSADLVLDCRWSNCYYWRYSMFGRGHERYVLFFPYLSLFTPLTNYISSSLRGT